MDGCYQLDDGERFVDAIDFSVYDDFSGVPQYAYNQNGELVNLDGAVIQDLSVSAEQYIIQANNQYPMSNFQCAS